MTFCHLEDQSKVCSNNHERNATITIRSKKQTQELFPIFTNVQFYKYICAPIDTIVTMNQVVSTTT